MSAVTVSQEIIDPAMATKILATNTHNRHMRPNQINSLKRDIRDGLWIFNGESIKIATDGTLLDGQHRLQAIIEADKPIETIVIRGLDKSAQTTVDTGSRRTFGDYLKLEGELYYTVLAGATRLSWLMDMVGSPVAGNTTPSTGELAAYLNKNPGLRDWAPLGTQVNHSAVKLPASLIGLGYQMSRFDDDAAKEFWRQILENDAKKGSAVFKLREQLIKDRMAPHPSNSIHRSALITKAWNYWMDGKEPLTISWRPGVEDFPKMRGAAK